MRRVRGQHRRRYRRLGLGRLDMRIVSWNIQWGRGVDGRVDLQRVLREARRFSDFDVLCLQEVCSGFPELPGCDGSNQFETLAQLLPGYEAFSAYATDLPALSGASGQRRLFGNMILSRLPVLQAFRHLLPWPLDTSVPSMQRVALELNLQTPARLLRVTTTHLEYYSAPQRSAQVQRLRELHQEAVAQAGHGHPAERGRGPFDYYPRSQAAVLCGDFNMSPADPLWQRLQQAQADGTPAYVDAWRACRGALAHAPTVGLFDREQWPAGPTAYDFFFVSQDLGAAIRRVEVETRSNASDHQPILLELS